MNDPSRPNQVTAATQTLALLQQQADGVRAELAALRQELAQVERDFTATSRGQLVEANEHLVLAAMRAQTIADMARSNLSRLARSSRDAVTPQAEPTPEQTLAGHDLQELREANEKLVIATLSSQEAGADAEEEHSRQITFLAMAAHELRNPLLPLRLAAQMLTRARTDERLLELQATINGQVASMARLIGDLLDGARVSTGKFRLERSVVELRDVLEQSIQTVQPAMDARSHRFRSVLPPGPISVHADTLRLVQVFGNLLENAAKYTPEGGEISLEAVLLDDAVAVTVSDNGIGITEEALPHVFELFVQDPHGTALSQGGLGIGLAVVRELVEAHGGTVVASSAGRDRGSRFVVTLPLAAAH